MLDYQEYQVELSQIRKQLLATEDALHNVLLLQLWTLSLAAVAILAIVFLR